MTGRVIPNEGEVSWIFDIGFDYSIPAFYEQSLSLMNYGFTNYRVF